MKGKIILIAGLSAIAAIMCALIGFRAGYPLPYRETVLKSGVSESLVYAVMKAESGFREDAVSGAGAVGVMQLLPSTARYICEREGIEYCESRLKEGEYNVLLGCKYLSYLLERFSVAETAIAAYNAGEGSVGEWLKREELSEDGETLLRIPYGETEEYVKKVKKIRKIYEFLYDIT